MISPRMDWCCFWTVSYTHLAQFVAMLNIDVVDLGVPVLSMHAPFEITSKLDIYNTYLAFKAFYK